MEQLFHLGLRGLGYNLIKSYMTNRKQLVSLTTKDGTSLSSLKDITMGVPQGSILGPLLFILYIQGTEKVLPLDDIILYADDTTLIFTHKDLLALESHMQESTNKIVTYFTNLNLQVNSNKSELITFGYNQNIDLQLVINESSLCNSNHVNLLGITLDKTFTWNQHIDKLAKSVSKGLFILRYLSKMVPTSTAKLIYFSLIQSHISYGIELWGSTSKANLQKIFVLQKRAIRYLNKLNFNETCRHAFRELGIMTVASLYIYKVIIYTTNYNSPVKNYMVHTYNTRNKENFTTVGHKLKLYEKLPVYTGAKYFNLLPKSLKEYKNLNHFRKKLAQYLLDKVFYSIDEFIEENDSQ